MDEQLTLIQVSSSWKLDEQTRRIGLRGVADARAALLAHRQAEQRQTEQGQTEQHADRRRSAA